MEGKEPHTPQLLLEKFSGEEELDCMGF